MDWLKDFVENVLIYFGIIQKNFQDNFNISIKIENLIRNIKKKNVNEKNKIFDICKKIILEIYFECALNIGLHYIHKNNEKIDDKRLIIILKSIIEFFKDSDNLKICSNYKKFNNNVNILLKKLYNKLK